MRAILLRAFVRRRRLHIVREDGAAVKPVDWMRWIFVGCVFVVAGIAWLVRHGR